MGGLCYFVKRLEVIHQITKPILYHMQAALKTQRPCGLTMEQLWWPLTYDGDQERIKVCRLLARSGIGMSIARPGRIKELKIQKE